MFSYEGAIARLEWVKEVNSLWSRGLLQPEKILHIDYLQYLKSLLDQFERESERSLQSHLEVTFAFLPYPVIRSLTKKLIQKRVKRPGKENSVDLERFQLFPTINLTKLICCLEKFKNRKLKKSAGITKKVQLRVHSGLFGMSEVGAGLFSLKIAKKWFLFSETRRFGPCPYLRSSTIFAAKSYFLDVFKEKIHVFSRNHDQLVSIWEVPVGWRIHCVVDSLITNVVNILILRDGVRRTMTFDLTRKIDLDETNVVASSRLSWVLKESEKVTLQTRYDFHEDSSDHLYDAVDILCNARTLPFDGNAITPDEICISNENVAVMHRKSGEMHKFITVFHAGGDDFLLRGQLKLESIESLDLPADAQSTWTLEEDSNLHFSFNWSTGRRLCFAHAVFSTEDIKGLYKLSHFRTTSLPIPEHYQKEILRMDFEIKDNIVSDHDMKILYAKIGAEVGRIVL